MRVAGVVAQAAVALLLLGACDTAPPRPTPSPTPAPGSPATTAATPATMTVGVVLPPPSGISQRAVERLRVALTGLEQSSGQQVGRVRAVRPDGEPFREDLAALLAEGGVDLVCVLGGGSGEVVAAVAPAFPSTRFCAAPAIFPDGPPADVVAVDVRAEEIGFLAGVAARAAAGELPVGLLGVQGDPALQRLLRGFAAGTRHAVADVPEPSVALLDAGRSRAPAAADVQDEAAAAFRAGAVAVYAPVGAAGSGAVRAARQAPPVQAAPPPASPAAAPPSPGAAPGPDPDPVPVAALVDVLGLGDLDEAAEDPGLLVAVGPDLAAAVDRAVEAALATAGPATVSIGVAEDAVSVVGGGHPAVEAALAAVQEARAGISDGALTVPSPP